MIEQYRGDNNTKEVLKNLTSFLENNEMPAVVKVGDGVHVAYGSPSSASPLGYAHVYKREDKYRCSSSNCKVIYGSGKQQKISKLCIHQHVLLCTKNEENSQNKSTTSLQKSVPSVSTHDSVSASSSTNTLSAEHVSSVNLNMARAIPYVIPKEILQRIKEMDAATILGVEKVKLHYSDDPSARHVPM